MNTPIGRISWWILVFLAAANVAIVTGLIWPGQTGNTIEAISWSVVAVAILLRIGIRTTPSGNTHGNDRRRF